MSDTTGNPVTTLHEWAEPPKPRQEWKVVVAVLFALIVFEGTIRKLQSKLSKDLVHQFGIQQIIDEVASADQPSGLFLGNSLIREGIDSDTFATMFPDLHLAKIHPDDTSVVEWRYLFDRVAASDLNAGDWVVIGYAQNQLTDDGIVRPRRLGAWYLNAENQADTLSEDVTSFAGRFELFAAKYLTSFAVAERIRSRVLAALVPMYEVTAQRLNRVAELEESPSPTDGMRAASYVRLERLLAVAKQHRIDLSVVAIPVGEPFRLDPGLLAKLEKAGVRHIDARSVPGIGPDSFPDGYHMDPSAAKLFTEFVAQQLRQEPSP
ncbi:hypothetical protein K227x_17930 [Rubripirellula lacrimiformis]|uniref:Uncharacterized protein n=1 Tax=Rubripirellula lacrimiformis TaxID=1930273 RepID=A0A517N8E8_9BACT|nr:hypothetical protein [Rubripirellula lacrimiformis]QDT03411.1 hypothetical protein K227x_17930 [Rubripirellula lacrimiformis]